MKKILASVLAISMLTLSGYMFFEPVVISAATEDSDTILVTQSVSGEISITHPSDVTMSPTLGGISGGTSDGYAEWTITCSDKDGFNVVLAATSTGTGASAYVLKGNTQGDWIRNYTEASYGVPDYAWAVPSGSAEFGYTATTTTSGDLVAAFLDNGSACNTGSGMTNAACWITASSTARTLMTRTGEAPLGTKLYINFRVEIDGLGITEDTYTATTTLTATVI